MIATGIVILISSVLEFFMSVLEGGLHGHPMFVKNISFIMGFVSVLFIPFAIFVLKRKKWAWIGSILLFSFLLVCFIRLIIYDFPVFIKCINPEISPPFIIEAERIEYVDMGEGQKVPSEGGDRYLCEENSILLPESEASFDSVFGLVLLPLSYMFPQIQTHIGILGLTMRTTVLFVFVILPLILFLYDRKNYWRLVSTRDGKIWAIGE